MKNKIIIIGVFALVTGVAVYVFGTRTDLFTGSSFGVRNLFRSVSQQVAQVGQNQFDGECTNNRCITPPVERKLRPNLVTTTVFLNAVEPDQVGTVVDQKFRWNNLNPIFPLRGVHYDNEVYALPFEANIRQAMGADVCRTTDRDPDRRATIQEFQETGWGFLGEYNSGSRAEFDAYCQWTNYRDAGRRNKTINRFMKAHFNVDELQDARIKKVTVELRHASGTPRKDVGVHVFTVERGVPLWKHNKYCILKGTDQSMFCSFDVDSAPIEHVVVARAKWNARAGVPYVHDVYLTYIEPPARSMDNVLVLNRGGDGEWQPGQNVGQMLGAQGGFLSADVTLPNGKVITLSLGENKCLADGQSATPFEQFAPALTPRETPLVSDVLSQMLGREIGDDEFTRMVNTGKITNTNQKISACDNTARCERSQEIMRGLPGGSPLDIADSRIRAEDYARGLLGGDERSIGGGGRETPRERFARQLLNQREYGRPSDTSFIMRRSGGIGGTVTPGDLVKINVQSFPNGASAITSTPMEFRQLSTPDGQHVNAVQPDMSAQNVAYISPNDKQGQQVVDALTSHGSGPARSVIPDNGVGQKADHPVSVVEGSPEQTMCAPEDDKCSEISEDAKRSLELLNQLLRSRGLPPISLEQRKLTPEEARQRRIGRAARPGGAPGQESGAFEPLPNVEECLLRRPDISEVAMPGPGNEPEACTTDCRPQDMAVGHTCNELQSGNTALAPNATCVTNVLGQRQQAIRCPEDNPNCAEGAGDVPEEGSRSCPRGGTEGGGDIQGGGGGDVVGGGGITVEGGGGGGCAEDDTTR